MTLMNTYAQLPVAFESGEGPYLQDTEGVRYLDALCGLGVTSLGHAHPTVTAAIASQAGRLLHTSNLYNIPNAQKLAKRLCALAEMDAVFFCNSGAEANEAAIKIARLYANQQKKDGGNIIVFEGSFHGRTMATLTATGSRKVQAGFEPLLSGFVRAPYNSIDAIRTIAANTSQVVAILVEPILGEGGIIIPQDNYLAELREICDEQNWLLMLDEVQTGNGRTGKYFAYQHGNVLPDVLTTAKGLANGLPIGACLARGKAASLLQPGSHATTFGGNPVVCAAALAVLESIERDGLLARAELLGKRMLEALKKNLKGCNHVRQIRGKGLMLAIELNTDCPDIVEQALNKGLLINVTQGNVVRLLPPLILKEAEADEIVATVSQLILEMA
jgi:acetylornithine/N-succinyldiaminopimelate aminotransferase